MVTPKQEREVIFPVWLSSYFTVFAILLLIAIGAILYFRSPGSMSTSPNNQHNIVNPADRTNAPHFSPNRELQQPQGDPGVDGRMMSPGRTLQGESGGATTDTRVPGQPSTLDQQAPNTPTNPLQGVPAPRPSGQPVPGAR